MVNKNMSKSVEKTPRLYVSDHLSQGAEIPLTGDHAHYMKNVLRKSEGDFLRLFNARNGEWLAEISALRKKDGTAILQNQIRPQPDFIRPVLLFFAPIKKHRMDFLIEKAVELGATDFYPVLTERSETRKIRDDRLTAQIIEASEQCERLDIPRLHQMLPMEDAVDGFDGIIFAAMERSDAPNLKEVVPDDDASVAFLIGPEGGFSDADKEFLQNTRNVSAISLGERILRAETAALKCLSAL